MLDSMRPIPDERCVTCSDEGRPGVVIEAPVDGMPALVRSGDGSEFVDVTLVGTVSPGDRLLVHAGTAIARIPQEETA